MEALLKLIRDRAPPKSLLRRLAAEAHQEYSQMCTVICGAPKRDAETQTAETDDDERDWVIMSPTP